MDHESIQEIDPPLLPFVEHVATFQEGICSHQPCPHKYNGAKTENNRSQLTITEAFHRHYAKPPVESKLPPFCTNVPQNCSSTNTEPHRFHQHFHHFHQPNFQPSSAPFPYPEPPPPLPPFAFPHHVTQHNPPTTAHVPLLPTADLPPPLPPNLPPVSFHDLPVPPTSMHAQSMPPFHHHQHVHAFPLAQDIVFRQHSHDNFPPTAQNAMQVILQQQMLAFAAVNQPPPPPPPPPPCETVKRDSPKMLLNDGFMSSSSPVKSPSPPSLPDDFNHDFVVTLRKMLQEKFKTPSKRVIEKFTEYCMKYPNLYRECIHCIEAHLQWCSTKSERQNTWFLYDSLLKKNYETSHPHFCDFACKTLSALVEKHMDFADTHLYPKYRRMVETWKKMFDPWLVQKLLSLVNSDPEYNESPKANSTQNRARSVTPLPTDFIEIPQITSQKITPAKRKMAERDIIHDR